MKIFFSILFFCILFSATTFAQTAEILDEFSNLACDEYLGRMDWILFETRKDSSANIYVFVYEGKETKYNFRTDKIDFVFPTRGSAKAKIASMKTYAAYRKVSVEKFKFIEAGFREKSTVEIWFVPKGAEPPTPTPTLEKMKYRKGKAKGFCVSCC